jgi:hypothetical protein
VSRGCRVQYTTVHRTVPYDTPRRAAEVVGIGPHEPIPEWAGGLKAQAQRSDVAPVVRGPKGIIAPTLLPMQ